MKVKESIVFLVCHLWIPFMSELEFHAIALGPTGLLIYCDSTKVNDTDVRISFTYKSLTSKQRTSHQTAVENEEEFHYTNVGKCQYKLDSLNKETEYEITANVDAPIKKNYTVKCKTSLKNNFPPEKPYFTCEIKIRWYSNSFIITWVPCGKERNCHGNEAGTHFAVKYKILDSRETATVIQHVGDSVEIRDIYPGKVYEITVISINGNSETPSDSQEAFHMPCSSPVRSVRVLTLTNSSIFVSWKQPKLSTENITHYALSASKAPDKMSELQWRRAGFTDSTFEQAIQTDLKPNIVYTFTILPYCGNSFGFEYRFDYSIKAIQTNFPLAKPDFKLDDFFDLGQSCARNILWIPCPDISDCKNMNFGSGCEMKIQSGNDTQTYSCQGNGYNQILLKKNRTYTFFGKSVNEFNQTSDSVSKRISCNGFEDI